jgi:hypothetical protein
VRRRDRDPDADEGTRTEADRDQVDLPPTARGLGYLLDRAEQSRRVARAVLGRTYRLLGEDRVAAERGNCRVGGRGVEADDRDLGGDRLSQRS